MERSRRLDDDALAEEIDLYADLVVAASEAPEADGLLPQGEIDRLLGVDPRPAGDDQDGDGPGAAG